MCPWKFFGFKLSPVLTVLWGLPDRVRQNCMASPTHRSFDMHGDQLEIGAILISRDTRVLHTAQRCPVTGLPSLPLIAVQSFIHSAAEAFIRGH